MTDRDTPRPAPRCTCKGFYPMPKDRDNCAIHGIREAGKPYWNGGLMCWQAEPVWPRQEPTPKKSVEAQ